MAKRYGILFIGAAVLSILLPGRRTSAPVLQTEPKVRQPVHKRLWALVQVRPQIRVLAVSHSRDDLEAELVELNATWNRSDLRVERQSYEIHATSLLQTGRDDLRLVPGDPAIGR